MRRKKTDPGPSQDIVIFLEILHEIKDVLDGISVNVRDANSISDDVSMSLERVLIALKAIRKDTIVK